MLFNIFSGARKMVDEKGEEWMTPREVAKRLNASIRTVYDLINLGRLRAKELWSYTGRKRFWLIPVSEVEKLKKERCP
jgi:excisionase family DNA binding protein